MSKRTKRDARFQQRRRTTHQPIPAGAPTPERARHGVVIPIETALAIGAERAHRSQPPLDRLQARARGSDAEEWERWHTAGTHLRADFEVGILGARDTNDARMPVGTGFGPRQPADVRLDAITRYQAALRALGPHVAAIVVQVACYEQDVQAVAVRLRRDPREVMGVLKTGLAGLADHYRRERPPW